MAEKVTLRKIFRDPVETKFGPGTRTSIFAIEYPDVRMTSFSKAIDSWKEGDEVMVEITKNGNFTNFKPADTKSGLEAMVDRLEKHVGIGQDVERVIDAGQQNDFNDF